MPTGGREGWGPVSSQRRPPAGVQVAAPAASHPLHPRPAPVSVLTCRFLQTWAALQQTLCPDPAKWAEEVGSSLEVLQVLGAGASRPDAVPALPCPAPPPAGVPGPVSAACSGFCSAATPPQPASGACSPCVSYQLSDFLEGCPPCPQPRL